MGKFKLAIGLHNHQPVGNFDHIFEEAHNQAYLPFIKYSGTGRKKTDPNFWRWSKNWLNRIE